MKIKTICKLIQYAMNNNDYDTAASLLQSQMKNINTNNCVGEIQDEYLSEVIRRNKCKTTTIDENEFNKIKNKLLENIERMGKEKPGSIKWVQYDDLNDLYKSIEYLENEITKLRTWTNDEFTPNKTT